MKEVISFIEIPVKDFDRAVKFYSDVLKLNLTNCDYGDEKMAFFETGSNVKGALSYSKNFNPSVNGTLVTFNAGNNFDLIFNEIKKLKLKVVSEKTEILADKKGVFALFIDSEGNKVGIYSET